MPAKQPGYPGQFRLQGKAAHTKYDQAAHLAGEQLRPTKGKPERRGKQAIDPGLAKTLQKFYKPL